MRWYGWHLLDGTWRRMAEADDLAECHGRLLAAAPVDTPSLHRCLTTGAVPIEQSGIMGRRDTVFRPLKRRRGC
jgi:hypothetical protein